MNLYEKLSLNEFSPDSWSEKFIKTSVTRMLPDYLQLYVAKSGDIYTKHWVIRKEFIPNSMKRWIGKHGIENDSPINDFPWPKETKRLKFLGILLPPAIGSWSVAIFHTEDKKIIPFDAHYVSYLGKNINKFRLEYDVKNPNTCPALVCSGDFIAGLLMPNSIKPILRELLNVID